MSEDILISIALLPTNIAIPAFFRVHSIIHPRRGSLTHVIAGPRQISHLNQEIMHKYSILIFWDLQCRRQPITHKKKFINTYIIFVDES